ncbi:unnamed protein product, partial [Ectocarpus sp. 12 AP-2014]
LRFPGLDSRRRREGARLDSQHGQRRCRTLRRRHPDAYPQAWFKEGYINVPCVRVHAPAERARPSGAWLMARWLFQGGTSTRLQRLGMGDQSKSGGDQ